MEIEIKDHFDIVLNNLHSALENNKLLIPKFKNKSEEIIDEIVNNQTKETINLVRPWNYNDYLNRVR